MIGDAQKYQYSDDLELAVQACIFEAKEYINEQKWGLKEGSLDFGEDDPFDGKVTSDQVPQAEIKPAKTKKTKKDKAA